MILARHLLRVFTVLLFSACGAFAAFATPLNWDRVEHSVSIMHLADQSHNLVIAARALAFTGDNVASTGASIMETTPVVTF